MSVEEVQDYLLAARDCYDVVSYNNPYKIISYMLHQLYMGEESYTQEALKSAEYIRELYKLEGYESQMNSYQLPVQSGIHFLQTTSNQIKSLIQEAIAENKNQNIP